MKKNEELQNELNKVSRDEAIKELSQVIESYNSEVRERFIVEYWVRGELWGYHASTFCQITDDPLAAKRYSGNPVKQMGIIEDNLRGILASGSDCEGLGCIAYKVKMADWPNVDIGEVSLDYHYLGEIEGNSKFNAYGMG